MSIQEVGERIKGYASDERVYLGALLVAVSLTSFTLGRASMGEFPEASDSIALIAAPEVMVATTSVAIASSSNAVSVRNEDARGASQQTEGGAVVPEPTAERGTYVASRKGTKYHLPWCSGGKAISEENKVWFDSKAEAEAAGYEPAKNCKGL